MTRLAVLSLKGGTGKTTVTLGLASAAARQGRRVVVVDCDPQGNASAALGIVNPSLTIGDALADGRRGIASDAVVRSQWPSPDFDRVHVIPADRSLEHRAASEPGSGSRLSRVLHGVGKSRDLVLIDCPPSLGELTRNALVAADGALIVTDPSYFALSGAEQAVDAITVIQESANPRLVLAGIVINRVRSRSREQTYRLNEVRESFADVVLEPVLTDRVCVPASQGAGLPIHTWPGVGAQALSADFNQLLETVLVRFQEISA